MREVDTAFEEVDLLLEMGLGTDGEVVIRSSGNTTFGNHLFIIIFYLHDRFWK